MQKRKLITLEPWYDVYKIKKIDNKIINKEIAEKLWDRIKDRVLAGHIHIKIDAYRDSTVIFQRKKNVIMCLNSVFLEDSGLQIIDIVSAHEEEKIVVTLKENEIKKLCQVYTEAVKNICEKLWSQISKQIDNIHLSINDRIKIIDLRTPFDTPYDLIHTVINCLNDTKFCSYKSQVSQIVTSQFLKNDSNQNPRYKIQLVLVYTNKTKK